MKSKATRSRRLSRMPNNRSLRDLLLHEKYCPHQKKEPKKNVPKVRNKKRMTFKQYKQYLENPNLPLKKLVDGIKFREERSP